MVHYSEEGLKLTQEDSSERVVEEYSGMDNISGMYKRTTYDKERKTTTVEYAYVGSEAIIGRYNENFAQMEQAYK
jgi:hypothetical protein